MLQIITYLYLVYDKTTWVIICKLKYAVSWDICSDYIKLKTNKEKYYVFHKSNKPNFIIADVANK